MDLCPRALPLRRRSLQRRRGALEVVRERMQIVFCINDIWKMVYRVLGIWFVDGRCGFLLRRVSRAGCQISSSMVCLWCCLDLIRLTGMVPSSVRHLVGPQNCILVMEPH